MSNSCLRELICRHGDWGYVLVALCLGLRLLRQRLWLVPAVICVLFVAAAAGHHRQPPQSRAVVSEEPSAASEAASPPAEAAVEDPPQVVEFTQAGDRWRFAVAYLPSRDICCQELTVSRNGRAVRKLRADAVGGLGLEARRITLPSGESVVGLLCFPGAGHSIEKRFLCVRDRKLVDMGGGRRRE